jgi:VanZ family protein
MRKAGSFLRYWLPVILWMTVIFLASSDTMSSDRTSRILGPLLHLLFPWMSEALVGNIAFGIRKLAHLTEYGLLGLLLWRALRKPVVNDSRPWSWPLMRRTVLLAALYAGTDEFHQVFVPSREARIHDVTIDTCGATVALLVLWTLGRWRKHW